MSVVNKIRAIIPGFFLCGLVTILALLLANILTNIGAITLSIFLGVFFRNVFGIKESYLKGIYFCNQRVLNLAIILLGFGLNFDRLSQLGGRVILSIVVLLVLTMVLAIWIGRLLRVPQSLCLLIGIGHAICGSSAIAASSSLVTDKKEEIAASLGVIHVLGILGLTMLPVFLGFFDSLSSNAMGVLIGGSLQAVGHVVAAGYMLDPLVGDVALTVKMGRVSLLFPMILVLFFWNATKGSTKKEGALIRHFPFYILGFLICALIANYFVISDSYLLSLKHTSHYLLGLAMAGIGLTISFSSLFKNVSRSFFLGIIVFSFQIIYLLTFVFLFP